MPHTLDQQRSALERANAVRSQHADIKKRLKTGALMIDGFLADPPAVVHKVRIGELVSWCPGVRGISMGRPSTRAAFILRDVDLTAPVSTLSPRMRELIGQRCLRYQLPRIQHA
jgi:hypothetical protein